MTLSPRVSVTLPTKNRPALLKEAVESVLSQTMPDLEVIVVDDYSEPPLDRALFNCSADSRLRIERLPEPRGAAAAKNRGIALSRAPLVSFLDDDDLYKPTYLEHALSVLDRFPHLDVVFMGVEFFSDSQEAEVSQHEAYMREFLAAGRAEEVEEDLYRFGPDLLRTLLFTGVPMAFQRPVARRTEFEKIGGYRGGLQYWDNDWTIRTARAQLNVALLNEGLYRQRIGPQQCVSNDTILQHCNHDLKVKRLVLGDSARGDADRPLLRQAVAHSLFARAYVNRDAGNWLQSFRDFIASQMVCFEKRRTRFLASFPVALLRSVWRRRVNRDRANKG